MTSPSHCEIGILTMRLILDFVLISNLNVFVFTFIYLFIYLFNFAIIMHSWQGHHNSMVPITVGPLYRVYQKKLNRFEIALNFAKQLFVSGFLYI